MQNCGNKNYGIRRWSHLQQARYTRRRCDSDTGEFMKQNVRSIFYDTSYYCLQSPFTNENCIVLKVGWQKTFGDIHYWSSTLYDCDMRLKSTWRHDATRQSSVGLISRAPAEGADTSATQKNVPPPTAYGIMKSPEGDDEVFLLMSISATPRSQCKEKFGAFKRHL